MQFLYETSFWWFSPTNLTVCVGLVSPRINVWGTSAEILFWWSVLSKFSTNQKHYPSLGSDALSVWRWVRGFTGKPVVASGKVVCFVRLLHLTGQLFQNVVNVVHGQVQKCEQKHSLAAVMVKYSQERISQNERKRKPPDGLSQGQKGQNVK